MNFIRRRPWILLVFLFLIPLIPWGIFIYVAGKTPMHRIDEPEPTSTQTEKAKRL
jgi:hypothetical protein